MRPVLDHLFATLAQADILGSLLRPSEAIDAAIADALRPKQLGMFEQTINNTDSTDSTSGAIRGFDTAALKQMVLERLATAFHDETHSSDPADALFGREAERGVRLIQRLDRQYAVVVTNPPYMGSKNMPDLLKKYVEQQYKAGKRDLYAAFILRCLDLCLSNGRVAMVTQQSWMFLRSFADLRAGEAGLLRVSSIEALAHLGEYSFEDASAAGAFATMFVLANAAPHPTHRIAAFRLVGIKYPAEKARMLREAV